MLYNGMLYLLFRTKVKVESDCDDDILSCSQMVYDCYPTERTNRVRTGMALPADNVRN